jgi:hypothetical protein
MTMLIVIDNVKKNKKIHWKCHSFVILQKEHVLVSLIFPLHGI